MPESPNMKNGIDWPETFRFQSGEGCDASNVKYTHRTSEADVEVASATVDSRPESSIRTGTVSIGLRCEISIRNPNFQLPETVTSVTQSSSSQAETESRPW